MFFSIFLFLTGWEFSLISYTSFYGELLDSIGDLKHARTIDVSKSISLDQYHPQLVILPSSSIWTFHLTISTVLLWIGSVSKLISITHLANLNLNSSIPFFIRNLSQLTYLNLGSCYLTSHISSWLANLTLLGFVEPSFV